MRRLEESSSAPAASHHLPVIVTADAPDHLIVPALRVGEGGFRIPAVLKVRIAVELVERPLSDRVKLLAIAAARAGTSLVVSWL